MVVNWNFCSQYFYVFYKVCSLSGLLATHLKLSFNVFSICIIWLFLTMTKVFFAHEVRVYTQMAVKSHHQWPYKSIMTV